MGGAYARGAAGHCEPSRDRALACDWRLARRGLLAGAPAEERLGPSRQNGNVSISGYVTGRLAPVTEANRHVCERDAPDALTCSSRRRLVSDSTTFSCC